MAAEYLSDDIDTSTAYALYACSVGTQDDEVDELMAIMREYAPQWED